MSFAFTAAEWAAIATAAVSAVSAIDSSQKQRTANHTARDNALRAQAESERATNRANAKSPDVSAMLTANMLSGKGGGSSTMLTGPGGVDPSQLTLGKSSLLGG